MSALPKIDLYKIHKDDYAATARGPRLLRVSPAKYLAIEGQGAPGGAEFEAKVGALYAVAFTTKIRCKRETQDYAVCKLEGQWWGSRATGDFSQEPREQWRWKLLMRTPDFVGKRDLRTSIEELVAKGKDLPVTEVTLETIREGRCVQMLHVGPYEKEGETLAAMIQMASDEGLEQTGLHHEIYLSDPRRVAPERLKTILRLPVGKTR